MEQKFQILYSGQQVITDDLNVLGDSSGLADDRVFAELFRMATYNGSSASKGVLPYVHGSNSGDFALVAPQGATGTVRVFPFRALIGSRTAVATDAKKNWRDIRSAICVGSTTLAQTVSIGANASGNPRWDLIWARVDVDVGVPATTRKIKSPTSKVITGTNVVTVLQTTATLGVQAGTPAASPAWPALPADSGSSYYIPIAYVRVPNGFGASSIVSPHDIATVAPVLNLARSTGGVSVRPASTHYTPGADVLTTTRIGTWGSSGVKPHYFMPSMAVGGEALLIALDLKTGSTSHASGAIIDAGDWRGRMTKFLACAGSNAYQFPWGSNSGLNVAPDGGTQVQTLAAASNCFQHGMGTSIIISGANAYAAHIDGNILQSMADGSLVDLIVDASTGNLKVTYSGAPNCLLFIWLEFSGVFDAHLTGS